MKNRNYYFFGSRDILTPILIYYVVIMVAMYAIGAFIGMESATYNIRKIGGVLVTIPFIYVLYFKPDQMLFPEPKVNVFSKKTLCHILFTVVIAILIGVGVNNLVILLMPVSQSQGFAEANEALFGSSFWLQMLNSALVTPVLEEMLYRGVIYKRMSRVTKEWIAIVASSCIFGFMHFNVIQFVYASILGMVLAMLIRVTGHFYVAVLGHIAANIIAICRNSFGFLNQIVVKKWWSYLLAVVFILAGCALLYMLYRIEDTKDEK